MALSASLTPCTRALQKFDIDGGTKLRVLMTPGNYGTAYAARKPSPRCAHAACSPLTPEASCAQVEGGGELCEDN